MNSPDCPPAPPAGTSEKPKQAPLSLRIYFQRHMTDLVRLIGYAEVPVEEFR